MRLTMVEKETGTNSVAIVAIIVLVLIVIGFLVYFFGFRGDTTKSTEQPTELRQEFKIESPKNYNKR